MVNSVQQGSGMPIFVTCSPNEAFVKTGLFCSSPIVYTSGVILLLPKPFQILSKVDLNVLTLEILSKSILDFRGVPIDISSTLQFRIGKHPSLILRAVENGFSHLTHNEIKDIVLKTMEGHQRSIISSMTIEEINVDRSKFKEVIKEFLEDDLAGLGFELLSYTIKDISDSVGYLSSLGNRRTAQVKRDAKVGEAIARKDASIRENAARVLEFQNKYSNETLIAERERNYKLSSLSNDIKVAPSQAQAQLEPELQRAKMMQKIKAESVEINIVAKRKEVALAEQEIIVAEKKLESEIIQVAKAEAFRIKTVAEGEFKRKSLEKQAEAETLRQEGDASASVIIAKAEAAAKEMQEKAIALQSMTTGAFIDKLVRILPDLTNSLSQSLIRGSAEITIVGCSSSVGVQKISKSISDAIVQIPQFYSILFPEFRFHERLLNLESNV